ILKSALLRRQPDFSESDLGFGSFARFLEAARDEGYVELTRDPKAGGYSVGAAEDDDDSGSSASSAPARPSSRSGSRDGSYDDAYFPEISEGVVQAINKAGLCALSHPTRLALLEQLVEIADSKNKRRRRVNIP